MTSPLLMPERECFRAVLRTHLRWLSLYHDKSRGLAHDQTTADDHWRFWFELTVALRPHGVSGRLLANPVAFHELNLRERRKFYWWSKLVRRALLFNCDGRAAFDVGIKYLIPTLRKVCILCKRWNNHEPECFKASSVLDIRAGFN